VRPIEFHGGPHPLWSAYSEALSTSVHPLPKRDSRRHCGELPPTMKHKPGGAEPATLAGPHDERGNAVWFGGRCDFGRLESNASTSTCARSGSTRELASTASSRAASCEVKDARAAIQRQTAEQGCCEGS
jgi:hypothetical protein